MSRSVPWRRTCPDKVSKRIERASRAQIYLLRTTGPTGFLLTAEGDERKFKVFLGDPHSCTCPVFLKERDLCIHILWILIKKFRVPKENSVIFQLGLVEREIGEIVHGVLSNTSETTNNSHKCEETQDSREKLLKKEITEDDVCPICQEDLFGKPQATTYCKYGCGNSIHIKCMKVWAEHQKSSGETIIKCPLCRVDFGSFELLKKEFLKSSSRARRKQDVHIGTVCAQCNMTPITGNCYRCTICPNYQLCKSCFASDSHLDHPFVVRQKSNQRWRPASKFNAIPTGAVNHLQSREITEDDYALLLQLDGSSVSQSSVPGYVLNSFPVEKIVDDNHRLVNTDEKCAVCYLGFKPSQMIRRLPCTHEFHRTCIDTWLSNEHNTCPVDGQTVYNSLEPTPNSRQRRRTGSNFTASRRPGNSCMNSNTSKKMPLSTIIKRQNRLPTELGDRLPQNFTLDGLGLNQRNAEATSAVSSTRFDRANSAPAIPDTQVVQSRDSASSHIIFDTKMLARPVISTEQVLRYGRHSGDSRLRRCMGLKLLSQKKHAIEKSQSLNDILLSGRAILSNSCGGQPFPTNCDFSKQSYGKHEENLMRTSIGTSPDARFSHIQIDI